MNHYVSTYQKDYSWPHVSGVRQPRPSTAIIQSCGCTDSRRALKELLDVTLGECFDWGRTAPMGRLAEPKICLTEPRPIRKMDLEIQCPDLYKMLEKALPNRKTALVEVDRMKTTYQLHYSDPAAARMTQRRESRVHDMDGQQVQCRMPIKIMIEADCPPQCRPSSSRHNGSTRVWKHDFKRRNGLKRGKICEDTERRQSRLASWRSEYQDSIDKIGQTIIRVKLHHMKRKTVPVLVTSN